GGEMVVFSIQNDTDWPIFCREVLRRPEIIDDPRFKDGPARVRNRRELDVEINAVLSALPRAEVVTRLKQGDLAYGAVSSLDDLARHPQLRRMAVATPEGPVDVVLPPAKVKGATPCPGPVPRLGEHNEAIRKEFAT
ncbi:MAG: CoA transferase, partial [Alphaproteobacteria bacterium]|nr:CoA transferase [Alphaproteobacteria bacterium]